MCKKQKGLHNRMGNRCVDVIKDKTADSRKGKDFIQEELEKCKTKLNTEKKELEA